MGKVDQLTARTGMAAALSGIEWQSIPDSAVPELTALCTVRQGGFRLPDEVAMTLLHIAREILSNVTTFIPAQRSSCPC